MRKVWQRMEALPKDQLVKISTVSKRLNICQRTIWRMVERGDFPEPVRIGKWIVRWRPEDIEAYYDRQHPVTAAER